MGNVIAYMSMSLDGFVAGPNDEIDEVFAWMGAGKYEFTTPGSENEVIRVAPATAELLRETWPRFGAVMVGRRTFDLSNAWGGKPPLGLPHVVVTHRVPPEWATPGSPFTFVTDGVAAAVRQARQLAGEKGCQPRWRQHRAAVPESWAARRNPYRSGACAAWCRRPLSRQPRYPPNGPGNRTRSGRQRCHASPLSGAEVTLHTMHVCAVS